MRTKTGEELGLSYSTLASSMAALLAVLAASVTAYIVFLQERKAQFDDKVSQDKIAIHDSVSGIEAHWNTGLAMYLPPEFGQQYQAMYPDKRGAELVWQAYFDMFWENGSRIRDVLSQIPGAPKGGMQGRVYLWLVTQVVAVITVSGPPGRPRAQDIFPASATGPGFDRWRKDFQRVAEAILPLSFQRNSAVADFEKSLTNLPRISRNLLKLAAVEGLDTLFKQTNSIKNSLKDIDNQTALANRYSISERLHTKTILSLFALALFFGIICPIVLLSSGHYVSRALSTIIATISIVCALWGSIRFGFDASSPYEPSAEYVLARWYRPLLKQVEANAPRPANGGTVDLDLFIDAGESPDKNRFPSVLLAAVKGYIAAGRSYNAAADVINAEIVGRLKNILGGYRPIRSGQYQIVAPLEVVNSERMEKLVVQNPPTATSFEVQGPWWSRVVATISTAELPKKRESLRASLAAIRREVSHSPDFAQFNKRRDEFAAAQVHLQKALEAQQPKIKRATQ